MFFSSIKGIKISIVKGISNIYLNVTMEKNRGSQNVDFLTLKNLAPGHFLGRSNSDRYLRVLKLLAATWYVSETVDGFFIFLILKEIMMV